MENFIRLNDYEKEEFYDFIAEIRAKIILTPKETFLKILENTDTSFITLNNVSETIKMLREKSYEYFLLNEKEFNGLVLENIAHKFSIPNEILKNISNEFYENLNGDYKEFKEKFTHYFGKYASGISPYIYELCLSNTNSRRSRAGKTLESVVYFLYDYFNYPFASQTKIGKKEFTRLNLGKVVDSILPSVKAFEARRDKTIIGSMKTTLRERWQEVVEEIGRSGVPSIYLLTCDDNISESKIRQMSGHNIVLVVLKEIKDKLPNFRNVISFEEYFSNEIPQILKYWNND